VANEMDGSLFLLMQRDLRPELREQKKADGD
jgi:hypothetical protein